MYSYYIVQIIPGDTVMKEIKIAQAPVFTSPNPMTFICSKKADGKTNMATLAFWTYASTNPGKVVFSLNKGAYTLELLAKNKEVVIAVPGVSLTDALIACGTSSGRATDKVEKFGDRGCGRPCSAYLQRKECLCGRKRRCGIRLEGLRGICRRAEKINYGISHQR